MSVGSLNPTDTELLIRYRLAPSKLGHAIHGLSDSDLNQSRGAGKWTIREIVHHIVECDLNYFQINRYALADTGRPFLFNEFDPNEWNRQMNHRCRPIQLELQLITVIREYIAYLCEISYGAFDRVLIHENGTATVRDTLIHDNQHAYHHIEQILDTKKMCGM